MIRKKHTFELISWFNFASNSGNPKCISSRHQSSKFFTPSSFFDCEPLHSSFSVSATDSPLMKPSSCMRSAEWGSAVNWNMLALSSMSISVRDVRWGLSRVIYPHVFCMSMTRDSVSTAGWWMRSFNWRLSRTNRDLFWHASAYSPFRSSKEE